MICKLLAYIPVIAIFLLAGCRSVSPKMFAAERYTSKTLLPLDLHVFEEPPVETLSEAPVVNGTTEIRELESRIMIVKEFRDNFFANSDETHGHAVFRIRRNCSARLGSVLYVPISAISLCSINLLGFPIASQGTTMSIDLEIWDASRNLISKYEATGKGRAYSAAYWGYGCVGASNTSQNGPVNQAAHTKALMKAISSLKHKIKMSDIPTINKRLLAVGPVPN